MDRRTQLLARIDALLLEEGFRPSRTDSKAEILAEIDAFLRRSGMSKRYFGMRVANDGKLVDRIRNNPTLTTTIDKVRAFIASVEQGG